MGDRHLKIYEPRDNLAAATPSGSELRGLRNPSPVPHAGAAVLLLLVATTLAIYKPRGMTRYGQRKQYQRRTVLLP